MITPFFIKQRIDPIHVLDLDIGSVCVAPLFMLTAPVPYWRIEIIAAESVRSEVRRRVGRLLRLPDPRVKCPTCHGAGEKVIGFAEQMEMSAPDFFGGGPTR